MSYQFRNGELVNYEYRDAAGKEVVALEMGSATSVLAEGIGLKDIIQLSDLTQDEQIRGPMGGVYILTGGPGVGKTSIALHRIPYLLFQQKEALKAEFPSVEKEDFFRAETMLVVVWKDHLVQYLQDCLRDLQIIGVQVRHVEDWVASTLRTYVTFGGKPGEYRRDQVEPDLLSNVKLGTKSAPSGKWHGLTENLLGAYLNESNSIARVYDPKGAKLVETELQNLKDELQGMFATCPLKPQFSTTPPQETGTSLDLESEVQLILDELNRLGKELTKTLKNLRGQKKGKRQRRKNEVQSTEAQEFELIRPVLKRARKQVSTVRSKLPNLLSIDFPATLAQFYSSQVVFDAIAPVFGEDSAKKFATEAVSRIEDRRLSIADRYLLLWLIHLVTRNGDTESSQVPPLAMNSHTAGHPG